MRESGGNSSNSSNSGLNRCEEGEGPLDVLICWCVAFCFWCRVVACATWPRCGPAHMRTRALTVPVAVAALVSTKTPSSSAS